MNEHEQQQHRDDMRDATREMVIQGRLYVREYAALHTPGVDPDFLQAIIAAVGNEISISEALAALEQWSGPRR
jgi:hypothetical protein